RTWDPCPGWRLSAVDPFFRFRAVDLGAGTPLRLWRLGEEPPIDETLVEIVAATSVAISLVIVADVPVARLVTSIKLRATALPGCLGRGGGGTQHSRRNERRSSCSKRSMHRRSFPPSVTQTSASGRPESPGDGFAHEGLPSP